jgi:hypothetical protein
MNNWYYLQSGVQVGPVSADAVRQAVASGQIQPTDLAWREGMGEWQPANTIAELGLGGGGAPQGAYQPQPQYGQPPMGQPPMGQPVGYYAPPPQRGGGGNDESMGALDWILAIICPLIGCIMGIVYVSQGKKKGTMMIIVSLIVMAISAAINYSRMKSATP